VVMAPNLGEGTDKEWYAARRVAAR
jgi:hypothetical protein